MISRASQIVLALGLAYFSAACDLEPKPVVSTISMSVDQRVLMEGQRVPAEDIYWIFSEYPVTTIVNFTSVTWESAEFIPRSEGQYIIDRWAVSGPIGVWTDSFILNVGDVGAGTQGRTQLLGERLEYQRLIDVDPTRGSSSEGGPPWTGPGAFLADPEQAGDL